MIHLGPAKENEHCDVVHFYSELIDSMRDSEFRPKWEMGVYPTVQMLEEAVTAQSLLVARLNDGIVGALILNSKSAPEYRTVSWQTDADEKEVRVIHALGVSLSCQGKGIAKQILLNVVELCRKNNVKAIRLDVLATNLPAAKLYLSAGFNHIATIQMFYEDTGVEDFRLYEMVL